MNKDDIVDEFGFNSHGERPVKHCINCKDENKLDAEKCKCGSTEFIYRTMTCLDCGKKVRRYIHFCRDCGCKNFTACNVDDVVYDFKNQTLCIKCNNKMLLSYIDNLGFKGSSYTYECENEACDFKATHILYH